MGHHKNKQTLLAGFRTPLKYQNLRGYRFTSGKQRDSGYRKKKGFHSANEDRITDERVLVRQRNGANVCLSCECRYTGAGGAATTRGRRPVRGRLLDQAGCSL